MSTKNRRLTFAAIALTLGAVAAVPLAIRARGDSTADKVWGTPRAEIVATSRRGTLTLPSEPMQH